MMKKWRKTKILILLFLPLLFSSVTTYIVYSSHIINYHEHFNIIKDKTFPDYSILIEDELPLLEPDFDRESFLKQFKLESVVYVGRLNCELVINSSTYDTEIFWAPEEYYLEHSKVAIYENEILMDESILNSENIEMNQELSLNFSYNNNNLTISTQVGNFIDSGDVLTSQVTSSYISKVAEIKYLFLLSRTFDEMFGDFFENLTIQYLILFEFSENIISSYLPHQLDDFLFERRIELDYYFDYTYNRTNHIESVSRSSSLESQFSSFKNNYLEETWFHVAVFYIVSFGICTVVITNTSRGFFKSQKEKIEFYYLRGSKKVDFLHDFLKLESKLAVYVLLIGFLISTLMMGILQPRLLLSGYNHALNLLVNCITALVYCSIQFTVSADSLSMIYRRNEKNELFVLNKIFIAFKNGLQWIILCIALAVSLYLYLFSSIEEVEFSAKFFYIYTLVILAVLLLIISRKAIIWIGERAISVVNHLSSVSKYTLKISRRVIRANSLVIQMLILFGLVCSFFVVGVDTINHYNDINQQSNSIGDIVITYPDKNAELVNSHLANFTEHSLEIEFAVSSMSFMIDGSSVSTGVKVFLLNSSSISDLLSLESFKQKYSGIYEPDQLIEDFNTNWNLSIINRAYAELASLQLGETTELSILIRDESPFYTEDWYNITILDIAEFIPLLSGISQEKPIAILNKEITNNRTEIDIQSIYQILWLNDNSSVQILEEFIENINKELNLGIEIFHVDDKVIFTDRYWLPSVLETLILSLLTVMIVSLAFFFYGFYTEIIKFQIQNFRTFFARGLSIKKGILYSVLPVFLFTLGYILMGFIIGVALLAIVLTTIQPKYYLKIPVSVFPFSFTFLTGQIVILCSVLLLVGIISYRRLQRHIPTVDRIVFTILRDEGDI